MKKWIDNATLRAERFNGDAAARPFFDALHDRRFQSTRCDACETTVYPPRAFCPTCGTEDIAWVDMPTEGTLYAFSQQHRSLRFFTPDVLGLVELPGCEGLVLTRIDAPIETLEIGQRVALDFFEISDDLTVHQFRPVDGGSS